MLYSSALQQKSFKKKCYFFVWKIFQFHKQVTFHATNNDEKLSIENYFGKNVPVIIAENFPTVFTMEGNATKVKGRLRLLSVALISPMKNYLEVLRALSNTTANVLYIIAGPVKESGYWKICQDLIQELPTNVQVEYIGEVVPNKVGDLLQQSDVFILPSESENYGHAIIEALSAGVPVITSLHTPWNHLADSLAGVNVEPDKDILQNAIEQFAAMDSEQFEQYRKGAISYFKRKVHLDEIKDSYKTMFG
jgi:glycosyltransferase involved in cell wall biosynthesis